MLGIAHKTDNFYLKGLCTEYENFVLNKQIKDIHIPVLSIGSVRSLKTPTYIYVDNLYCTCYLLNQQIKEGWGYNPWGRVSEKWINKAVKFEHEAIIKAKAVFCMGEWLCNYAKEFYSDCAGKIFCAKGGTNSFYISNDIPNRQENTVLFIGRDFYRKGGDIILKAVDYLNNMGRSVKLIIAGPQNISSYNKPWLEFVGDVSYQEAGKLMSQATLFCMPSRFEAFGLVFAEALLNGMPCIGRDAFEMPFFIKEGYTGELIKSNSYLELAEKIRMVLDDRKYHENVKLEHTKFLQKYNWSNTAQFISDTIEIFSL